MLFPYLNFKKFIPEDDFEVNQLAIAFLKFQQ